MECKGKIVDVSRTLDGKSFRIVLEINGTISNYADIESLVKMDELKVKLAKWTQKRSLNANAYFHVLVGKIADVLRISKTRAKNMMICRYGQLEMIDDEPVIIKTNIQPEQMWEQEFLHCMPCKTTIENEKKVVFYKVFRGSSDYNSMEMASLIDGTVQDAKDLNIETVAPDEIERMKRLWQTKDTQ